MTKNIGASVRARLTNQARAMGVSLPSLIERFAIGRLLWRLSLSSQSDRFVLKGAQLFSLWADQPHRPTRDLDLLSFEETSVEATESFFRELLADPIEPEDGLIWGELSVVPIRDDQRYGGVRVSVRVFLDGAQIPVQIDIGFGDSITPAPEELIWKGLLDFPEARLLAYPPETVIAEKFQAAVDLELSNSRMKNFYDLDWLQAHREFEFAVLREAIAATFMRRGAILPSEIPLAFTERFWCDPGKRTQWEAFLRKNRIEADSLEEVVKRIHRFLAPLIENEAAFSGATWNPTNGWTQNAS